MASLTETLRVQHRNLEELATKLTEALAASQVDEVRAVLNKLAVALTAHLQLEDAKLYPEIEAMARQGQQSSLVTVAQSFSISMSSITVVLTRFVERAQKGVLDLKRFEAEWKTILNTLQTRIHTEETSLYPIHEKLTRKAVPSAG
jgi:hemerythrin-like domain-containing protein